MSRIFIIKKRSSEYDYASKFHQTERKAHF